MRLTLMQFNVQDLFIQLDYPLEPGDLERMTEAEWQLMTSAETPNKPLAALRGVAQVFAHEDPDVAVLNEVGGHAALVEFNRLFLGDRYHALLVQGNSTRGIETGFLVKKGVGLKGEVIGHRDWPVPFLYTHEAIEEGYETTRYFAKALDLGDPAERRFSRDVPELRLFKGKAKKPFLVVLGVHLKSGFDPHGIDPAGRVRRQAEWQGLVALHRDVSAKLEGRVPIVVMGDMNGHASREDRDPEFAPLYETLDWRDALEVAGCPRYERVTHMTFFAGKAHAGQLDYIFLPPELVAKVVGEATRVHRYRFPNDPAEIMPPFSFADRRGLPSDHYPVVCQLAL